MEKSTYIGLGIFILIVVGGFLFLRGDSSVTDNVIAEEGPILPGETQQVVIGEKDFNYYPNEIRVKANQPVELTLDKSVTGCLRSFNIKDLGVQKSSRNPDDKITFIPTKKGNFRFACSMGMGYGSIIVE